jgi:hypothetical protein
VEPLGLEEFAVWENLSDYPPNLKDKKNEVMNLTGLVSRMVGIMVNLAKTFGDFSFEELFSKFHERVIADMQRKHDEYVCRVRREKEGRICANASQAVL